MLPENILESHTALCVKLSKCERLLVTSDEDLNKVSSTFFLKNTKTYFFGWRFAVQGPAQTNARGASDRYST